MILEFGGSPLSSGDNTVSPSSLHFALETLDGDLFGVPIFPTLASKAASLAWHIIRGHVFMDGNKRTGMEAARLFLDLNGVQFPIDNEVIEISERIAQGFLSLEQFTTWLDSKLSPVEPQQA
jgi:death-on-curing protein